MSEYLEMYKSLICIYAAKIRIATNCLNCLAIVWAILSAIAFNKKLDCCFSVLYILFSVGLLTVLCFGWYCGLSSDDIKKSEDFLKKMDDEHYKTKDEYGKVSDKYIKTIQKMNIYVYIALFISVILAVLVIANNINLRN